MKTGAYHLQVLPDPFFRCQFRMSLRAFLILVFCHNHSGILHVTEKLHDLTKRSLAFAKTAAPVFPACLYMHMASNSPSMYLQNIPRAVTSRMMVVLAVKPHTTRVACFQGFSP